MFGFGAQKKSSSSELDASHASAGKFEEHVEDSQTAGQTHSSDVEMENVDKGEESTEL